MKPNLLFEIKIKRKLFHKLFKKSDFIIQHRVFKIVIKVKNIGDCQYQGGELNNAFIYSFTGGVVNSSNGFSSKIPNLKKNESYKIDFGPTVYPEFGTRFFGLGFVNSSNKPIDISQLDSLGKEPIDAISKNVKLQDTTFEGIIDFPITIKSEAIHLQLKLNRIAITASSLILINQMFGLLNIIKSIGNFIGIQITHLLDWFNANF